MLKLKKEKKGTVISERACPRGETPAGARKRRDAERFSVKEESSRLPTEQRILNFPADAPQITLKDTVKRKLVLLPTKRGNVMIRNRKPHAVDSPAPRIYKVLRVSNRGPCATWTAASGNGEKSRSRGMRKGAGRTLCDDPLSTPNGLSRGSPVVTQYVPESGPYIGRLLCDVSCYVGSA